MRLVFAAFTLLMVVATGCSLEDSEPSAEPQPTASASPEQGPLPPVKQQLEDAHFVYQTAWEGRSEDGEEFVANREVWERDRTAVGISDEEGIFLITGITFHGNNMVSCELDELSADLEESLRGAQALRDGMQEGSIDTAPDPERGNREAATAGNVTCWT